MPDDSPGSTPSTKLTLPPGLWPAQVSGDVVTCLLSAMVATLPIRRDDITAKTVPSKPPISADGGGWKVTLLKFEALLRATNAAYGPYRHKAKFGEDTLNLEVPKISDYLRQRVLEAINVKTAP